MLKSIRLQNFFGFQDCTINLEKGANVLVGINGSGKSNFFKAIRLLKAAVKNDLKRIIFDEFGGIENVYFAGVSDITAKPIRLTYLFDFKKTVFEFYDSIRMEIEILPSLDRRSYFAGCKIVNIQNNEEHTVSHNSFLYTPEGPKDFSKIKDHTEINIVAFSNESLIADLIKYITFVIPYENFDTSKSSQLRLGNSPRPEQYLVQDGSNLASLLNYFNLKDKAIFKKMVGSLNTINPYYTGINSNQLPGITELWLEEEKFNRSVPSSHISDGTLKFLCLMSILYNPNRGFIVCIDEPELGLHPDMINTLHEAIEFASETSQIIISTHSAHLLNYFDIEQVRVFEKDENNATIVEQYSKADFAGWHQKFQTGKAWREGDIGGKRW